MERTQFSLSSVLISIGIVAYFLAVLPWALYVILRTIVFLALLIGMQWPVYQLLALTANSRKSSAGEVQFAHQPFE